MTEFNKYLKEARQEFCKEVNKYTVSDNLQLRTACDSFLIAFDQATEQAINYTHSCTVENEQLRFLIDKFQTPKGNYLIELLMTEKERKDKKP